MEAERSVGELPQLPRKQWGMSGIQKYFEDWASKVYFWIRCEMESRKGVKKDAKDLGLKD